MSGKKKETLEWRKLDNSAKLFPLASGKRYSTVFRLSAVLKEKINPRILEKAVKIALEKYPAFKMKLKKGFFWNYLEHNTKDPIIEKENEYPCKYINPRTNRQYLFKVTYFENKINIDIFHALTDGNNGSMFFREIVYSYLEMAHQEEFKEELRYYRKPTYTAVDEYIQNYDKKAKNNNSSKKAYVLKGGKLPLGEISAIHEIIDIDDLKNQTAKQKCTITQYLTAVLIQSIYKANVLDGKEVELKRPIKICIPVNLKRYFPSDTITNFFSYMTLEAEKKHLETFENILEFVKNDFSKRLTEEEIKKTMSSNVKLGVNPIIKVIPLFLKKPIVRLSYLEIRKYTTMTFSNIGRIGIVGKYQKYIDNFFMLIAPEPVEKIKCSACTFNKEIVVTFTSILNNSNIEKEFYKFLTEQGIKVRIESNGVLDVVSTEIE